MVFAQKFYFFVSPVGETGDIQICHDSYMPQRRILYNWGKSRLGWVLLGYFG